MDVIEIDNFPIVSVMFRAHRHGGTRAWFCATSRILCARCAKPAMGFSEPAQRVP